MLVSGCGSAQAGQYRLTADATGYVDETNPDRVAYRDGSLRAEDRWQKTQSYLRFDVGYVTGKITGARLLLTTSHWGHADSNQDFNVYALKDSAPGDAPDGWSEPDLEARNAPANELAYGVDPAQTVSLGTMTVPGAPAQGGTPASFTSSQLVSSLASCTKGYVTLILSAANDNDGNSCFYSRYALIAKQPVLEITTSGPDSIDLTQPTLRMSSHPRQTLEDYGCGNGGANGPQQNFGALTQDQKAQLSKLLFTDSNRHTLRIWVDYNHLCPHDDGTINLHDFQVGYVDDGLIKDARAAGVTTLLLSPSVPPSWMYTTAPSPEAANQACLRDDAPPRYGALLAETVLQIKKQFGIAIDNCSIANECVGILPRQWPVIVKTLRAELDKRGLQSTKISAVDWPSFDGWFAARVGAIKSDPDAWNALDDVSGHSYSNPMIEDFYQAYSRTSGKGYWCTETECGGPTPISRAWQLAAHLLSDLNHGCSRWIYHESALADNQGNPALLVSLHPYDNKVNWLEIPPKQEYFRQIGIAVAPGAKVEQVNSTLEGDMLWSNNAPTWDAAGGLNADGSYALAITKSVSVDETPGTLQVAIDGLAKSPVAVMKAWRSGANGCVVPDPDVVLHHGVANVTLAPGELLTLRSSPRP